MAWTFYNASGEALIIDGGVQASAAVFTGKVDLGSNLLVGNAGSTGIAIDSVGAVNMAAQPAFLAVLETTDSNVTGGGTVYTLGGGNALVDIFDQGGDFATATFTAPITGRYLLSFSMRLGGLATNQTLQEANVITSNRTYRFRNDLAEAGVTNSQAFGTVVADMDLNDTVTVTLTMSGGSDVVDVETNAAASHFAGVLLV